MREPDGLASPLSEPLPEDESARQLHIVIPPRTVTTQAICVTRTPADHIQVLDWVCVLGRTFRQTFDPRRKTMKLELYPGQTIDLDPEQTRHLINYLHATDGDTTFSYHRSPRAFLDNPEVKALIDDLPSTVERTEADSTATPTEAKP